MSPIPPYCFPWGDCLKVRLDSARRIFLAVRLSKHVEPPDTLEMNPTHPGSLTVGDGAGFASASGPIGCEARNTDLDSP